MIGALVAACGVTTAVAQADLEVMGRLELPLKTEVFLAGNFGELRSNHFHGGLDFRTEGRVGLPVFSVDEGYVSRVSISHYGAGKALYVQHPGDIMSVYFHLDRFTPELTRLVEEKQHEVEKWALDYTFKPGEFPVKRGEQIAFAGNTGSSDGPHLHFELHDTKQNLVINPKHYYGEHVKDTRKPIAQAVTLYELGDGFYDPKTTRRHFAVTGSNGVYRIGGEMRAWGRVALGVRGYDVKNDVHFKYGIRDVKLYVDDTLRFESRLDAFPKGEARLMNSLIDYPQWRINRQMIMKSLVDEGNRTPMFPFIHANRGVVEVKEERLYKGRYELTDYDGNQSTIQFDIRGARKPVVISEFVALTDDSHRFKVGRENRFVSEEFRLILPQGVLFEEMTLRHSKREAGTITAAISPIFQIHDANTPMVGWSSLELRVNHFSLIDPSKFYVGQVNGGRLNYLQSAYQPDGYVKATFREFGEFALAVDTVMPSVKPIDEARWGTLGLISFAVSDAQTGLRFYKGYIDGKFVLFEPQKGSSTVRFRMNRRDVVRGKLHTVRMVAQDMCGNETVVERQFRW